MTKMITAIAAMVTLVSSMYANFYTNQRRFVPESPCGKECRPPLCEQGKIRECLPPLPCAANAPAHYRVISDCKCWQAFVNVSFLYWQALEEGLTLAWSAPSGATPEPSGPYPNTGSKRVNFDFDYRPGFKLGIGNYFSQLDDWAFNINWTHFGFKKKNKETPDVGYVFTQNEWLLSQNPSAATDLSIYAVWRFKLNFLDFDLSRPFYNSNRLILTPFFGARAAWITQRLRVAYALTDDIDVISNNKSNSWALGARGGFNGNWLLGLGFRLQGNAAASLLFTDYHIRHSETNGSTAIAPATPIGAKSFGVSQNEYTGRFLGEMGLGLGWGAYFKRCQYHIDFSANYDFNYLPQQNVMRQLVNDYNLLSATGAHDLFIHGLTVTGRLDF